MSNLNEPHLLGIGSVAEKVAIVTGGASGIGKAITELFVRAGGKVVIADVKEEAGRAASKEYGDAAYFFRLDITDEDGWQDAIATTLATFGRLDILVNNAGIFGGGGSQDPEAVTLAEWRTVNSVNVEGVVLGCKYAIPAMRQSGGGSIINLSSIAGVQGTPNHTAYGASKAAVHQYTKSVALYCGKKGDKIRCNAIHPGYIDTPILDAAFSQEEKAARRTRIPVQEFGAPEDVARAVLFLASDAANYVTGTSLFVDGGVNADR